MLLIIIYPQTIQSNTNIQLNLSSWQASRSTSAKVYLINIQKTRNMESYFIPQIELVRTHILPDKTPSASAHLSRYGLQQQVSTDG